MKKSLNAENIFKKEFAIYPSANLNIILKDGNKKNVHDIIQVFDNQDIAQAETLADTSMLEKNYVILF